MDKDSLTIRNYYNDRFDVPLEGRDDEFMGTSSIHLYEPAFIPVIISDLVKAERIINTRGGMRGKDYIISCHYDQRGIGMITLHTTNKFLSKDDFLTDDGGNTYVLE